jgi:hypothetical protein
VKYYELELLRDIAWSLHSLAKIPDVDESDDLNKEATEAMTDAVWPEVREDEWCGDWKEKRPKECADAE